MLKKRRPEIIALYAFSALYPVQHYIMNNIDEFSLLLAIQFTLIAGLIPAGIFLVFFLFARPLASDRAYYLVSLSAAIAIFAWYMRPLFRQFSVALSSAVEIDISDAIVYVPVSLVLFGVGYRFRSFVAPFLTVVLLLSAFNLSYKAYAFGISNGRESEAVADRELVLQKKPSVYILVADGYQDRQGLMLMGLEHLDIGRELSEKGFRVYESAYSNYRSSLPSMTSFLDIRHHYYRLGDWENIITGNNKLYSALRSHGYKTVVAHPNDYMVRGQCNSDVCYPAPNTLGQVGFILAETIYYREDFTERTSVGMMRYRDDFYQILENAHAPAVIYSHVSVPNHGPNGCSKLDGPLKTYEDRLKKANEWLRRTVEKIESIDDHAIIMILGDHGAMLTNNCSWFNPDVRSIEGIVDNLGVLMAVKWPEDYDNRYDDNIHSLMDLSWYLLQYLSEEAMDEDNKPNSASYLWRMEEDRIYRVIQDGRILLDSVGNER